MDIDFSRLYEEEQSVLWGYCYRLSGNAAEAEDLVQDTFVRAMERPPADLSRPWRPWLVRVATHLAYDRARRSKKSEYVGPWLPTPVPTDGKSRLGKHLAAEGSASGRYDMKESASVAFLVALEALTASQRVILLLRDVYDYSVKETAEMAEVSEAVVKTTLHRAREALKTYDGARIPLDGERMRRTGEVLEALLHRLAAKDVTGVRELLAEKAVSLSDGNGRFYAAKVPVEGAEKVALFYSKIAPPESEVVDAEVQVVNHLPALVMERPNAPEGFADRFVLSIQLDTDDKIAKIFTVLSQAKLVALPALH